MFWKIPCATNTRSHSWVLQFMNEWTILFECPSLEHAAHARHRRRQNATTTHHEYSHCYCSRLYSLLSWRGQHFYQLHSTPTISQQHLPLSLCHAARLAKCQEKRRCYCCSTNISSVSLLHLTAAFLFHSAVFTSLYVLVCHPIDQHTRCPCAAIEESYVLSYWVVIGCVGCRGRAGSSQHSSCYHAFIVLRVKSINTLLVFGAV